MHNVAPGAIWRAYALMASALVAGLAVVTPAQAQSPEAFYKNKTVTLYVGYKPSGAYDAYARLLAKYLPRHIPGHPAVIVLNKPGAATLVLANTLYNIAPRDGTAFGLIQERMGLLPLIAPDGIKYDALKFNWIGSMSTQWNVCLVWHSSPIKTIADARKREVIVGGSNVAGSSSVYPRVLNAVLHTKFKLINGYEGPDIDLALERGEIEGRCGYGWPGLKASKPDWVRDSLVRPILQMGMTKEADLPDVPLIMDMVTDPDTRLGLEFLFGTTIMGRPFVAPPGVPADRVAALRAAFDETVRDPELLAQAAVQTMEISPISGAEISKLLVRLYATPQSVRTRLEEWQRPKSGEQNREPSGSAKTTEE